MLRGQAFAWKKLRVGRALLIFAGIATAATAATMVPNLFPFKDASGVLETQSSSGSLDEGGPFFQALGTNGRACSTCHLPQNAFGLSAASVFVLSVTVLTDLGSP